MNANQLREQFAALPPIEPITGWDKHRLALRDHVANHAIERFLRWSTIQATMFVGEAPYIRLEYDEIAEDWRFPDGAIEEPGFGSPQRLSYAPYTSGNLVHQAYHLKQWLDRRETLYWEWVVEFGGGYGAMAFLMNNRKLPNKHYTLYDLPELSLLQEFYLSNVGISNVDFIRSDMLVEQLAFGKPDLLIALYSLSEAPIEERAIFLNMIPSKSYLFAYQQTWDGVDNHEWFNDFASTRPDLEWHNWRIPHMPVNWYMVGV